MTYQWFFPCSWWAKSSSFQKMWVTVTVMQPGVLHWEELQYTLVFSHIQSCLQIPVSNLPTNKVSILLYPLGHPPQDQSALWSVQACWEGVVFAWFIQSNCKISISEIAGWSEGNCPLLLLLLMVQTFNEVFGSNTSRRGRTKPVSLNIKKVNELPFLRVLLNDVNHW